MSQPAAITPNPTETAHQGLRKGDRVSFIGDHGTEVHGNVASILDDGYRVAIPVPGMDAAHFVKVDADAIMPAPLTA